MTPDQTTLKIITAWITRLADVTAHKDGKPDKSVIATYAALLAQTHVSGAFTVDSLAHVTAGREWFPAVAVLSGLLAEWWREHAPRHAPAIRHEGARPEGWDKRDEEWLDFWHRRCREIGNLTSPSAAEYQRKRLASLMRQMSPLAWEVLTTPLRHAA